MIYLDKGSSAGIKVGCTGQVLDGDWFLEGATLTVEAIDADKKKSQLADIDSWREQFQAPDAAELDGSEIPGPPAGWPGWPEWAADRWPSLAEG